MRHVATILICAAPCLVLPITLLPISASAQTAQSAQAAVSSGISLQDAAVELGHRYDSFYRQKDVAGMASLYAVDGELVSPSGKKIKGREALENYYRQRFASGASDHKIIIEETHPVGDSGYSVASFSVSVPASGSERHVEQGHIAAVYAHDASGWHFALVQPSVTPAAGG
jgi:uncharacterized protein (TIGR02246 family)